MLLLNEKEIKSVVSMRDIVEADKTAFRMIANGTVEVPLRTGIKAPAHDGTFLFMPSYAASEEAAAVKLTTLRWDSKHARLRCFCLTERQDT